MNRRQEDLATLSNERWKLCYLNVSEYIITLHNCQKKTLENGTLQIIKSVTMKLPPWNLQ